MILANEYEEGGAKEREEETLLHSLGIHLPVHAYHGHRDLLHDVAHDGLVGDVLYLQSDGLEVELHLI